MSDDTIKAIIGYVVGLCAADADTARREGLAAYQHLVAAIEAQFPEATKEERGEGLSRGLVQSLGRNFMAMTPEDRLGMILDMMMSKAIHDTDGGDRDDCIAVFFRLLAEGREAVRPQLLDALGKDEATRLEAARVLFQACWDEGERPDYASPEARAAALVRSAQRSQDKLFELEEIALETGLPWGPDVQIGPFLDQAVALGNARAKRLRGVIG